VPPRQLSRRDLAASARRPDAEVRRRWARVLARSDGPDAPLVALLQDWSAFAGLDWEEMMRRIAGAEDELAREFEERKPRTAEDFVALYPRRRRSSRSSCGGTRPTSSRQAARWPPARSCKRPARGGCWTSAAASGRPRLRLRTRDWRWCSPRSPQPLRFAQWRLRERGREPAVLDLRSDAGSPASGSLDGAVAFDVLEHMPDITVALARIDRLLAAGGILVANQIYVSADEGPHHFPQGGEALKWLHARGYRLAHVPHVCWIAQKAPLAAPLRRVQGAQIQARIAAARVAAAFERGPGRPIARRVIGWALR
jgi:hypothetical protein